MADDNCGALTHSGDGCKSKKLPGFPACLAHMPEELLDAAEAAGFARCRHSVSSPGNKNFGKRCARVPVMDTGFCQFHQPEGNWLVPMKWKDRRIVYRIRKSAAEEHIDLSKVDNPLQALLEVAAEAMALKDEMKRRVVELRDQEWRYGAVAGEQIRGEILLYERALDRVAKMLVTLARLGIEERLARVTERQAVLVEKAITAALEESGVSPELQDRAKAAVARRLRAVE